MESSYKRVVARRGFSLHCGIGTYIMNAKVFACMEVDNPKP